MNIDELQKRFNELRAKKWVRVSDGLKAEFIGFRLHTFYPFFIQLGTGETHSLTSNLSFLDGVAAPYIREVSPYADWPIDAKAIFWDRDSEDRKLKGHFAGINDAGYPKMYANGTTSFTNGCGIFAYHHAELAEPEGVAE